MNEPSDLFIEWLEETFGAYNQPREHEFVIDCPVCGAEKRCYVNPVKRLFYCQKCGKQESHSLTRWLDDNFGMSYWAANALLNGEDKPPVIGDYQSIIAGLNLIPQELINHNQEILYQDINENFKLAGYGDPWVDTFVEDYLERRGFTLEDAKQWRLGFAVGGAFANRIILPVYERGELVYFQAGTPYGIEPKYKNPKRDTGMDRNNHVFNLDCACSYGTIYVCEGAYNAMSIGRNAIALFGKSLSQNQLSKIKQTVNQDTTFVISLDYGADKESLAIVNQLIGSYRCGFISPPDKRDYNDLLVEGGSEAVRSLLGSVQWVEGGAVGLVNYQLSQKTAI